MFNLKADMGIGKGIQFTVEASIENSAILDRLIKVRETCLMTSLLKISDLITLEARENHNMN